MYLKELFQVFYLYFTLPFKVLITFGDATVGVGRGID